MWDISGRALIYSYPLNSQEGYNKVSLSFDLSLVEYQPSLLISSSSSLRKHSWSSLDVEETGSTQRKAAPISEVQIDENGQDKVGFSLSGGASFPIPDTAFSYWASAAPREEGW